MVNGKCTCHDGSKYNKGECKKIGKYKGGKRVKNRCVCDKGYKLKNSEWKPVNEQCKGGKMVGKKCTCPKGFKVNKWDSKNRRRKM